MKITGYTIERQIGQGGMAIVYHAIQESLGRPVALKVMNPLFANSPEFSERFLDEGRMLASLQHSHIITIYDIGVSDGFHYISMEYVDGGDLRQQMRDGIAPDTALDYLITLGSCLQAAHDTDIVHRDIKPMNILFRKDGTLLLTDFGIAKQLAHRKELTATGSMIGSPYYFSPEQALGSALDGRADIYSLGIVLYEMLIGEKPFEGNSEVDIALKHIEHELPRLPQVLSRFQPLLDRMTAKKPEDRFSNAASMGQAAQDLRDTGWWDGRIVSEIANDTSNQPANALVQTPMSEKTIILDRQRQTESAALHPVILNDGVRVPASFRNVAADKWWKGGAVVGVLVLAIGIVTSGLLGSGDKDMSLKATHSTRGELARQVKLEEQAERVRQAELERQAELARQAERKRQAELARQAERKRQAKLARQAERKRQAKLARQAERKRQTAFARQTKRKKQAKINELLLSAQKALLDSRLTLPRYDSAFFYYRRVLKLDPKNSQAKAGFSLIADRYFTLARKAFDSGRDAKARSYVQSGLRVKHDHPALRSLGDKLRRQDRGVKGKMDRLYRRAKGIFN